MGKVITIVGPHGVGKTTLFKYAKEKGEFETFDGFKINCGYKTSFDNIQKLYFEKVKEQNLRILNGKKDGLVIRSMEEILFFYEFTENHISFNIPYELFSNKIIYIDAKESILKQRCENDYFSNKHNREIWYQKYFRKFSEYWKKYPNLYLIDTSNLTTQETYEKIKELIHY